MNRAAFGAGLVGDQIHAKNLFGNVMNIFGSPSQFDAATFAASASVNLRFDDYGQAQFFRRCFSFGDSARHNAARHFDIETAQQFFPLILMNLHKFLVMMCGLEVRGTRARV